MCEQVSNEEIEHPENLKDLKVEAQVDDLIKKASAATNCSDTDLEKKDSQEVELKQSKITDHFKTTKEEKEETGENGENEEGKEECGYEDDVEETKEAPQKDSQETEKEVKRKNPMDQFFKPVSVSTTVSKDQKFTGLIDDLLTVQIVQIDITKEKSDAITNAANEHLMHGGGVAGAISSKGGRTIQ